MSTRGFIGIKRNGKIIGRFNHWDSYYDGLGKEVIDWYFAKADKEFGYSNEFLELADYEDEDSSFIHNGLFCEFAYVWNEDNDTLEIYRGFFKKPQFEGQEGIMNYDGTETYYEHLIFVVDKKTHTKEQVLQAFEVYQKSIERDSQEEYPERNVMPFEFTEEFKF